MSIYELMAGTLSDLWPHSLRAFAPELALCGTIVCTLLARVVGPRWPAAVWYVAMAGSAMSLWLILPDLATTALGQASGREIFTGMLIADGYATFLRAFLLAFALVFVMFVQASRLLDDDADATEFTVLSLSVVLGMCIMVSANHLLMVFLGIEMASVPCYVLAGILRRRRAGAEASLKYAVYGAAASGVMLYGISLLGGAFGSLHLPTMARRLADLLDSPAVADATTMLIVAGLMLAVGLAFKLSAFPFHYWAPDVFEGAPAEIGAFLSVASKAAALGLTMRLAVCLAGGANEPLSPIASDSSCPAASHAAQASPPAANQPAASQPAASQPAASQPAASQGAAVLGGSCAARIATLAKESVAAPMDARDNRFAADDRAKLRASLLPARKFLYSLFAILAATTCTLGNLAAYGQTNIKRLLAYSTIAHAGYLLMPVCAAVVAVGSDLTGARHAVAAMLFYLLIYFFMNFGAFAVAAAVRQAGADERIESLAGLGRRSPVVAVCFSAMLFSLVGIPPLAGFTAKFVLFGSLVRSELYLLLVIAGLNTAISLFYYLRVVRVMFLRDAEASVPTWQIPALSTAGAYIVAFALPLLLFFVWWDGLLAWAETAAMSLI